MKINVNITTTAVAALVFVAATSVKAQVGVAVQFGSGPDGNIASIALITNQDFWTHSFTSGWSAKGHLETNLAAISGKGSGSKDLWVFGVTPVLRFAPRAGPGYFEVGVGANYFDKKKINDQKSVGTHFEFGDFLGAGVKFGDKDKFEFGYRFIHYSNAGISSNNPGIDFHMLRLRATF